MRLLALALALSACTPPAPHDPAPETPASQAPLSAAGTPEAPASTAPAEQGPVTVQVLPQFSAVTDDVRQLNLLVRLKGEQLEKAVRPPLDLALVIDRSGSMRGDKMRAVKAAGLQLIDALTADDRVTLVSYSDDVRNHTVRQPVDAAGREMLRQALLGIEADGMTALGPATFRALDLLGTPDPTRAGHVMLLSDGLANRGEKRPEQIAARAAAAFQRGVSVSTLGVGVDYNEDLMTRLADAGGGRYHFIESSTAVARVLEDELNGLVATVARGVELDLALPEGARLVKVFGYPVSNDDGRHSVRVGALGSGQSRDIIVRIELPAERAKAMDLGMFSVRFIDVPADGVARRIDMPVQVDRAGDAAAMRASEAVDVTVRVAEVESADQLEMAARAAERGDFDGAKDTLKIATESLKRKQAARPSPKLAKQIREFEEADREMAQARRSSRGRKAYTKKFKSKAYDSKK